MLQQGDSQFPSGIIAYSWGLEGMLADGMAVPQALPSVISGMLRCRWAPFDRVVVRRAWRTYGASDLIRELDADLEASLLAPAERAGSQRAGATLLATHLRLGNPAAAPLREQMDAGSIRGHRAVVEGVLWRSSGLTESQSALLSGYGFVNALCAAGVRLGYIGAFAQQQLIAALVPDIAELAMAPLPLQAVARAFNPVAEIAMIRQPGRDSMLFAT